MNLLCSSGSRSFVKETRTLKMICSNWPLEVDNNQVRAIIKADPLTPTREVAEKLDINYSMFVQHLKQIGKVKNSISGCPMSWAKTMKKNCFEVLSYLILYNNEQFLNWIVTCDEKWILYNMQWPSSVVGPIRSSKTLPKAKIAPKKIMVTLCWSTAGQSDPVQLSETLQRDLRSIPSKLTRCSKNWNAQNQHQSSERAQSSVTIPNHTSHSQHFKT